MVLNCELDTAEKGLEQTSDFHIINRLDGFIDWRYLYIMAPASGLWVWVLDACSKRSLLHCTENLVYDELALNKYMRSKVGHHITRLRITTF